MRRLVLKLPTVLQVDKDCMILFHNGSTFSFLQSKPINHIGLESPPNARTWAPVDPSQLLSEPALIHHTSQPSFVVEAASRLSYFNWANKVHHIHFYAMTWSLSEVLQTYVTLPPGFTTLTVSAAACSWDSRTAALAKNLKYDAYRASPRALGWYARTAQALVTQQVREIRPNNLRFVFQSPDFDESSHFITCLEPSPTERFGCQKTITSQSVLGLL